jgi:hypothetical protein
VVVVVVVIKADISNVSYNSTVFWPNWWSGKVCTKFEFDALSLCPCSKRLTHLTWFSVCASLPPIASLDDVSSTFSINDVLHDLYSWKASLNKQGLKEHKGNELWMEEMLLPILILHKLVLGLGSRGWGAVCVYCMLGEWSKHSLLVQKFLEGSQA